MNTEERRARLEAKLRGWLLCKERSYGLFLITPDITQVIGDHSECRASTDPTTPAGAWEWVRLLKLYSGYSTSKQWQYSSALNSLAGEFVAWHADPIAAVTAAVDALALKEFPDDN